MNRSGAASFGRCNERRRLKLVTALRVSSRKEKTMEGEKTETAPRPDKDAQRGVRGSSMADAWRRRRRSQSPVWPASYTVTSTGEPLFLRLIDFDSNLTKIKVVEEKKIYNFRFGRKLIRSSVQGEKRDRKRLSRRLLCERD